jgi:hypothetical protein
MDSGGHLHEAQARAHPTERTGQARVAGIVGGEHECAGRCSGVHGDAAAACKRVRRGAREALRMAVSARDTPG